MVTTEVNSGKVIQHTLFVMSVMLLAGCDCKIEAFTYTHMANHLDDSIYVEYRYQAGESRDGGLSFIYDSQTLSRRSATTFEIKSETRTEHNLQCVADTSDVVETSAAPVQFSLSTLSQYTICDALGFKNQYDGEVARYQFYPPGSSCGDYRTIDISEGY